METVTLHTRMTPSATAVPAPYVQPAQHASEFTQGKCPWYAAWCASISAVHTQQRGAPDQQRSVRAAAQHHGQNIGAAPDEIPEARLAGGCCPGVTTNSMAQRASASTMVAMESACDGSAECPPGCSSKDPGFCSRLLVLHGVTLWRGACVKTHQRLSDSSDAGCSQALWRAVTVECIDHSGLCPAASPAHRGSTHAFK